MSHKKKYEVLNYTFLGVNKSLAHTNLYKYEINLNKSTLHTNRLFNGIAKGLNDYEHHENLPKWKQKINNIIDKLKF